MSLVSQYFILKITVSIGLNRVLRMVTSLLQNQMSMVRSRAHSISLSFTPTKARQEILHSRLFPPDNSSELVRNNRYINATLQKSQDQQWFPILSKTRGKTATVGATCSVDKWFGFRMPFQIQTFGSCLESLCSSSIFKWSGPQLKLQLWVPTFPKPNHLNNDIKNIF